MIMSNEENEWVDQIVRYIHLPSLLIHHDSDFEAEKKREGISKISWTDWKFSLPIWQQGFSSILNDNLELFILNVHAIQGSFLLLIPPPPTIEAQILTSPTQKRTRLWLAKIHSRVSWNITPLIISHILYGVRGSQIKGGGINRKDPNAIYKFWLMFSKCWIS